MLASISFYTFASAAIVAATAVNNAPEGKLARRGFMPGGIGGGIGGGVAGGFAGGQMSSSTRESTRYSHQSSSTSSFSAQAAAAGLPPMFGPFCGLPGQIATAQSALVAGVSSQVAFNSINQVALSFQQALQPFLGCGSCGLAGAGLDSFQQVIQSISTGFQSLIGQCQSIFPNQWNGILSSAFGQIGGVFPQLFNFCNGIGLPPQQVFGGQFAQSFSALNIQSVNSCFSQFGLI